MNTEVATAAPGAHLRRATCGVCTRPQNMCLCRWVRPVAHTTEVLILQHPLETRHAKNTARLLHLSLVHSSLRVGEVFDPATLASSRVSVLLYPPDLLGPKGKPGAGLLVSPVGLATDWPAPDNLRLFVLDATWRKSRKMLHLNPWLRALPRLSLSGGLPSAYRIRKAHRPNQLSTLEATCAALLQLEGDTAQIEHLLEAFNGFVEEIITFLPSSAL